jgi:shikimate kinase
MSGQPGTSGYYDYAPTVSLGRPVACTGHPGSGWREIVYDAAALTGLPLHDVDHRIEHEAGESQWAFARQRGGAALQALAADLLPGVLAQSPPGLLAVGEGALLDETQLRTLRASAALVFFRRPATACYWELRRRAEGRDGLVGHPWLPDRLESPADLQPLLAQLKRVEAAADLVIDMEGRGVHDAVMFLQERLPQLGEAT